MHRPISLASGLSDFNRFSLLNLAISNARRENGACTKEKNYDSCSLNETNRKQRDYKSGTCPAIGIDTDLFTEASNSLRYSTKVIPLLLESGFVCIVLAYRLQRPELGAVADFTSATMRDLAKNSGKSLSSS